MRKFIEQRRARFMAWVEKNGGARSIAKRAGVHEQTLYAFINGRSDSMKGTTQETIARAHGVTVADLFGDGTDPTRPGIYPVDTPFRQVPIRGEVRAGAWMTPQEPTESLPFADPALADHDLAAWIIGGTFSDGPYPAGSYVIVDINPNQVYRVEDHIILIRPGWQGLIETTIKETDLIDDVPTLREIGKGPVWWPDPEENWTVGGLVVRTYRVVKPKSTRPVRFD